MKRVLLVDDDEVLRSALADTLVIEGYAVTETTDGAAAKGIMSIHEYDLVIVDMKMPHVTGGELFDWAQGKFPTPFIIISGYVELHDKIRTDLVGTRYFLDKPFKGKVLIKTTEKALAESKSQNEHEAVNSDIDSAKTFKIAVE